MNIFGLADAIRESEGYIDAPSLNVTRIDKDLRVSTYFKLCHALGLAVGLPGMGGKKR